MIFVRSMSKALQHAWMVAAHNANVQVGRTDYLDEILSNLLTFFHNVGIAGALERARMYGANGFLDRCPPRVTNLRKTYSGLTACLDELTYFAHVRHSSNSEWSQACKLAALALLSEKDPDAQYVGQACTDLLCEMRSVAKYEYVLPYKIRSIQITVMSVTAMLRGLGDDNYYTSKLFELFTIICNPA